MLVEHKTVPVTGVKVLDEAHGVVETIVSVTGIVDEVKDIIEAGAYAQTLRVRTPKGVWGHDWNTPVSKTLQVDELMPGDPRLPQKTRNGDPWPREAGALLVKTQFNLETQRGKDAYSDVKFFGDQQEWSIGYQVPVGGATVEQKSGIRRIQKIDLFEYSPVLFGAMPEAATQTVKMAQLAHLAVKQVAAPQVVVLELVCPECGAHDVEDGTDDLCATCGATMQEQPVAEDPDPADESQALAGAKSVEDVLAALQLDDADLALFNEVKALVQREDRGEQLTDEEIQALFDAHASTIDAEIGAGEKARDGVEVKVEDSPKDVEATERLHRYWAEGEGAAKIRWGTPGDFDRCVRHVRKFLHRPGGAEGYCNLLHHRATGEYPSTHAEQIRKAEGKGLEALRATVAQRRSTVGAMTTDGRTPEEKARRVATNEGARVFHLPIGSLIGKVEWHDRHAEDPKNWDAGTHEAEFDGPDGRKWGAVLHHDPEKGDHLGGIAPLTGPLAEDPYELDGTDLPGKSVDEVKKQVEGHIPAAIESALDEPGMRAAIAAKAHGGSPAFVEAMRNGGESDKGESAMELLGDEDGINEHLSKVLDQADAHMSDEEGNEPKPSQADLDHYFAIQHGMGFYDPNETPYLHGGNMDERDEDLTSDVLSGDLANPGDSAAMHRYHGKMAAYGMHPSWVDPRKDHHGENDSSAVHGDYKDISTGSAPAQTTSGFGGAAAAEFLPCPRDGRHGGVKRENGKAVCAKCGAKLARKKKAGKGLPLHDPDGFVLGLEEKAGRVLSTSNADAIKTAVQALLDVLEKAGIQVDDSEPDDDADDVPQSEDDTELKDRRVATPAGAARFHKPIGSPLPKLAERARAAADAVHDSQDLVDPDANPDGHEHMDYAAAQLHDAAGHLDAGDHHEARRSLMRAASHLDSAEDVSYDRNDDDLVNVLADHSHEVSGIRRDLHNAAKNEAAVRGAARSAPIASHEDDVAASAHQNGGIATAEAAQAHFRLRAQEAERDGGTYIGTGRSAAHYAGLAAAGASANPEVRSPLERIERDAIGDQYDAHAARALLHHGAPPAALSPQQRIDMVNHIQLEAESRGIHSRIASDAAGALSAAQDAIARGDSRYEQVHLDRAHMLLSRTTRHHDLARRVNILRQAKSAVLDEVELLQAKSLRLYLDD